MEKSKIKKGSIVTYHPNEIDRETRPKNAECVAIVLEVGEKEIPTKKDDKGVVIETKKVESVDLLVFQNVKGAPTQLLRQSVVGKKYSANKEIKFQAPFFS